MQSRIHPSAFHSSSNSNITTLLRVYLSGWVMGEDKTFFLAQLQREDCQGLSMTIPYPAQEPSSPLKCLFFLQAGIAQYDTQATAKKPCLLLWIFLSGCSKVQVCHKEKAVGNQGRWSSWQTEGPWQQGSSPTVRDWGNQRRCGDGTQLGWEFRSWDKITGTKQNYSWQQSQANTSNQSLDRQCPQLGMGMTVAQLQGKSGG